jgi:hypothetical protein
VGGGDVPATTGHIELWSEEDRQGTMYLSLDIDALGNFYTEKIVDFKGKCYPVLVAPDGQYSYMSDPYTSGGCNSCHDGNTTDPLQLPG